MVQVVQVVQMVQVVSWGSLSDTKSDHFLLFFSKNLILQGTIDLELILLRDLLMNNHSYFFHSHRLAVLMEVLNPVSSVFAFLSRTIEEAFASKIFLDELNVLMAQQKYCTSEVFHR